MRLSTPGLTTAADRTDRCRSRHAFVMVCGTPASGKTRLRHAKYAQGYVTVDAGDIFRRLPDSAEMDFPGEHAWMVDIIGTAVAVRALEERRHVVTEVFGLDQPAAIELIEAMKAAGYRTEVVGVRAGVEQSVASNEERATSITCRRTSRTSSMSAGCVTLHVSTSSRRGKG